MLQNRKEVNPVKIKFACLMLAICLLLGGCNFTDGKYISVVPHEKSDYVLGDKMVQPHNYSQLRVALQDIIRSGLTESVIDLSRFDPELVNNSIDMAIRYVKNSYPLAAYAVNDISYELGTRAGTPAMSVQIDYRHSDVAIRQILNVSGMKQAKEAIAKALENCSPGVVLMIPSYREMDIDQFVKDYAQEHPDSVMEIPEVAVALYPDSGSERVLELSFTYQNSRENLRKMQDAVKPVFASAELYVSGASDSQRKYTQLYSFLMGLFSHDFDLVTSITPSYSLLIHGVGDERAFAEVYAYMCRQADLECLIVTGTYNGEPHTWNIVKNHGVYSHVDMLECYNQGYFEMHSAGEMLGHVWDYSAYPSCELPTQSVTDGIESTEPVQQPESTEPVDPTEPSTPELT